MAFIIDHYGWYYGSRQRCSIQDFPVTSYENRRREVEYENLRTKAVWLPAILLPAFVMLSLSRDTMPNTVGIVNNAGTN